MLLGRLAIAALTLVPLSALAVGFNDDEPPQPTETTTECPDGSVYDEDAAACVVIQDSRLDDDALYRAARELAYVGRLQDALAVLALMSEPNESRVQTYLGFVHRQLGDDARALHHYMTALRADPDNVLARSYLGMAHIAWGEPELARAQLQQIRARGAAGSWADRALARTIRTGFAPNY